MNVWIDSNKGIDIHQCPRNMCIVNNIIGTNGPNIYVYSQWRDDKIRLEVSSEYEIVPADENHIGGKAYNLVKREGM